MIWRRGHAAAPERPCTIMGKHPLDGLSSRKNANSAGVHNGIATGVQASAIEASRLSPRWSGSGLMSRAFSPPEPCIRRRSPSQAQRDMAGAAPRNRWAKSRVPPLHARRRWRADKRRSRMLSWGVVVLGIAIIAGILGFCGIASTAAVIAQVVFFIFVVIFVIALILGLVRRRPPPV